MHPSKSLLAAFALALASASAAPAQNGVPRVTSPKEAFGHEAGADYTLVNYTKTVAYLKTLAGQSDRMKLVDIGPTEEGRRQMATIISSPANLAQLDRYRTISRRLAKAEGISEAEAKALAAEGKAVVWIDAGLHANEVVPPQSLLAGVHDLLSKNDAETRRILDDVIIIYASANPDGQELISDWYMRESDPKKREFNSVPRLYQKYVGHDINRDFFLSAQAETTNINRVLFRQWFPQIIYNQHQTSPAGAVVFVPPFRDPFNYNYDPLVMSSLDSVGAAMHGRLIAENKPGSTSRSGANYSTWNNGMERSIAYFHNSVGLLTEIFGHPTPAKLPLVSKVQIARNDLQMPVAPQTWHLSQSVDYTLTMNRAVLDYASRNREHLLFNIWRMGTNSIERGSRDSWTITPSRIDALDAAAKGRPPEGSGRFAGLDSSLYDTVLRDPAKRDARVYILPADQPDFPNAVAFANALIKTGVDVDRATKPFRAAGKSYPAGSLVIRAAQAYRPHILDMFEPQDHPHNTEYPGGPPIAPYDAAGYTLALQMGLKFDRVLDAVDAPTERVADVMASAPARIEGRATAGFLVPHDINNGFILTNRLLKAGQPVFWQREATRAGGRPLAPGAIWIPLTPESRAIVTRAAADLGVPAYGVAKAPGGDSIRLRPARIALVDKYGGLMTSGWTRWLLEHYEFPFTTIYPQRVNAGGLERDFDTVLLSEGAMEDTAKRQPDASDIPADYRAWLGDVDASRLVAFMRGGGSVLAIGSSTRLYKAAGLPLAETPESGTAEKAVKAPKTQFYIPGSLLRVAVDGRNPLAFGAPAEVDMVFDESPVFQTASAPGVRTVGRYPSGKLLRSGWAQGQERLVGNAALLEADVGKGRLFMLAPEVNQRAQSSGSFRFLFNGLLYGSALRP